MTTLDTSEIERVFREESGRAVAVLVRQFRDIDVAEEAVQDASSREFNSSWMDGIAALSFASAIAFQLPMTSLR